MAQFRRYTYNGVTVQATGRRSSSRDDKKYERTVKRDDREITVHYGSPDMEMRRDNPEARRNFLSRHNCSDKRDPSQAGFWACLDWARPDEKSMVVVKQDGERRRMYIVASNAYRDREEEIVKEQALHDYVDTFDGNDLLFWHRGAPIGNIVKAEMAGPFLIEEAVEADDRLILTRAFDGKGMQVTTVKAVWDHIAANPDVFNAASIGFRYAAKDKADNSYSLIFKRETSVLPHWAAANPYTFSEVNNNE